MFFIVPLISAYVSVLFFLRKNILLQELCFLFIYIINVTLARGLDIALPIYYLFSLFPFLNSFKKMNAWSFFLLCYLCVYLVIGIFFQDAEETIAMFISRCWQFLFFFIVYYSEKKAYVDFNYVTLFKLVIILEAVLAIYLYISQRDLYDIVRLTAGAQPITGNISVVMLPIISYCFYSFNNVKAQNRTIFISFILAIFVSLSGTRGYELVFFITFIWILWDYTLTISNKRHTIIRIFLLIVFSIGLVVFLFIVPEYLQRVLTILRINKHSIGIRTFENKACIDFMWNAPIRVVLFGVGMGGKLGDYSAFLNAIYKQFAVGMWDRASYLNDSGALFHNLYANYLCGFGLTGIIIFCISGIKIWKIITRSVENNKMRISFKLFFLGFLIMNYFRWSTDCGIAIMCVFALILKKLANENHINCSYDKSTP